MDRASIVLAAKRHGFGSNIVFSRKIEWVGRNGVPVPVLFRSDVNSGRFTVHADVLDSFDCSELQLNELLAQFRREWDEGEHPRDENGRFAGGGGGVESDSGSQAFVSPNVSNLTFDEAEKALNSDNQRQLSAASADVDRQLGLTGVVNTNVVGAWSDGAENSIHIVMPNATEAELRVASAMKGYLAYQKSVLVFSPGESGNHFLAEFQAKGSMAEIHANLLQDGLAFHTLQPSADGATVYVFGSYSDAATVEAIGKSVEQNDTQARFTAGSGSFIGTQLGDADTDDKGQRDDARKVYEAEIQQADAAGKLPGRDIGKLWQQVRDSWAASSSQVKLFRGGGAWDEGEHPRDEQGRFTDSGGSGESSDSGGDGSASDTSGRTATELFQSGDRTTDIEKAIDSVQGAREMIAKAAEKLAGATRTDALVSQGGHRHPDGRYTAEREALHMKILAELFTPEAIKAATPKAGEKPVMTVLGGRGGSGKTWFTSSGLADRNKAIYVNSDDFKSALPEYAGWNAALVHEESTHILAIAEAYAREIGVNVIEDATLKNAGSTQQRVEEYKKSGYEIHGYYMYVSPQMSMERALGRFVHGTEKAKGDGMGRFVAPEYLAGALTNEMSFDNVKGEMSKWGIYDNMGGKPKLYAESK